MSTADLFGSDSSGNEFDPAEAAAEEEEEEVGVRDEDENAGRTGKSGSADADVLEDSDDDNNNTAGGGPSAVAFEPATGGTGLSDSEDEEPQQQTSAADAAKRADADVFGTDSEDDVGAPSGGGTEAGGGGSGAAEGDVDPFEDSDDDGDQGGGSGSQEGKTLRGGGGGRLSKAGSSGKGKGKKRKAGADGGSSKKKSKSKTYDDGDASTKKKKKKKRKKKDGEEGGEGEGGGGSSSGKKKKGKKKKGKKKRAKTSVESSTLQDLGLESSADEAADEEDDDDFSDEELEHEDEEEVVSGEEAAGAGNVRTRDDDDFIDNSDDNADILEEYQRDAPEEGDHSEAEEDNGPADDTPKKENPMSAVLASMKKRKAQELGTAEREQIAQEFMFKINQAAEDDEESVQNQSPAIYKLKMLPTLKATLAKKELQETFLEFDLLGVLKRWLQPYSNKQLPNLTVRRAILELIRGLPVQIDHLKRSGIGKTVMGLLNCKEETTENKRILRELVSKWNRPVYEKETSYRAMRPAHDDDEAMEVRPRGAPAPRRRVVSDGGSMSRRDGPSRDEAVGNILNARAKGLDPTKSRVPFSNGYAFSKAPRSRIEGNGRAAGQQVDTSARAKMLKKIASLAKPVSK